MNWPVLGIVGGVGPLATACFMESIIRKTPARVDQDHMPIIVVSDPQIPDRTSHILDHSAPNPQPEMERVARRLQNAGADYLAIACNTAHYYYAGVSRAVGIPVLNIMEETSGRLASCLNPGATVGLLATEGTVESGVFQECLGSRGMHAMAPDEDDRRKVMSLIYDGVKAGGPYDGSELVQLGERLMERGCDAVIVGCTELSVIYRDLEERPSWFFDSLDILADRCVEVYQQARATGVLRV